MARTPKDVTDAELAVLQVLWERGPCTRRQIAESLYPDAAPSHVPTVQKLLERLEENDCVARSLDASPITFTATIDREQLINRRLWDVADKLCGGSLTPLLMNLVRAKALTARQLRDLQELLAELNEKRRPRDKPR